MRNDFALDEFFETLGKNRREAAKEAKQAVTIESGSYPWHQGKLIPAPVYDDLPCDVEPFSITIKSV